MATRTRAVSNWYQVPGASSESAAWVTGYKHSGYQQGAGLEVEKLGHELEPIWGGSNHYTTVTAQFFLFKKKKHMLVVESPY